MATYDQFLTEPDLLEAEHGHRVVNRLHEAALVRARLDSAASLIDCPAAEVVRAVDRRENLRLVLETDGGPVKLFGKRHTERSGTHPTAARVEWDHLVSLRQFGIATAHPVALAEDIASGRSVIFTQELPGAEPLDDMLRRELGTGRTAFARLARQVGRFVSRFHASGFNHRDLYLCHIFIAPEHEVPWLWLIDLQRVQQRRRFRRRWIVKDLAQLYYSWHRARTRATDVMRFLRAYFDVDRLGPKQKKLVRTVLGKVRRMQRRHGKATS